MQKKFGRVHELLINSEKVSTSPVFGENVERFLCLRFSITHTNDLLFFSSIIENLNMEIRKDSTTFCWV